MENILRRRNRLDILPYSLAMLGLLLIMAAGFNLLLSRESRVEIATIVEDDFQLRTATDRAIERLQERLEARPEDQPAYVQLASVYLQKVRETADPSYYTRAEDVLLRALEMQPDDSNAMTMMGSLNLGLHQFQEALTWAERALEVAPDAANTYGVLGDAQLELGQYDAAADSFQAMIDLKPNLDSYSRVSYIRELMGDVDGAIEAMQTAAAAGAVRTEATAWVRVQLGNLYFGSGRPDEASKHYEAALRNFSDYYLALAALGKARAGQGFYDEAINLYERAVEIFPQPSALAALGDLYARTGNADEAQLQYDTVGFIDKLGTINQVLYNRQIVLFYADHDLKPGRALELARKELTARKDIYGYDAFAWALFKSGQYDEAADAITEAMKLGTQDANLYYHAGMIYNQLGDKELAREYLEYALLLNPEFSILQSDVARRVLADLGNEAALSSTQGRTIR